MEQTFVADHIQAEKVQGIDKESTPPYLERTQIEVKSAEEHITPISGQEPGELIPGAMFNYNDRTVPTSAHAPTSERFDFLDLGDPTFASPGFIAPRRDPHPHVAQSQQFGSKPADWRAQHDDERVVNTATKNRPVDSGATQLDLNGSIPWSSPSNFNVSNSPFSSSKTSPVRGRPFEHLSPKHHQSVTQPASRDDRHISAHGLVLEDFSVAHSDPSPKSSLAAFSNRFLGTASRNGTDVSTRTQLPAGVGGAPGAAVVPSDMRDAPSGVSVRNSHAHKLSPGEHYDIEFDDFYLEDKHSARSENVASSRSRTTGRLSPQANTVVLVHASSPTLRAAEVKSAHATTDSKSFQWETPVGDASSPTVAPFSQAGERTAAQHALLGEFGQGGQLSSGANLTTSSHSQIPYLTGLSREQDAASLGPQIPNSFSPRLANFAGNSSSSDATRPERQSPASGQNPQLIDAYFNKYAGIRHQLDSSSGTEALRSGAERDVDVEASPRTDRMRKQKATVLNGQIQSSSRPQQRNTSRLWRSQQPQFSPLPTASTSSDEEEEIYDDSNEGMKMLVKDQARSGSSRGRRHKSSSLRHCHQPKMTNRTDSLARRQLLAVVVLCLIFMAAEAVGGVLANSLALFTDVLHLGSDLVSFVISLLAMWLANKPPTRRMSFGYHRAEVLGALFSVLLIWLVSGALCYIAVERIVHEHYKNVKPDEMLITASLGVLINFIMGFVLHSEICCGQAHSHNKFSHGHSHGHSVGEHNHHNHTHGGTSCSENNRGNNHVGSSTSAINPGYDYTDDKGLLDVRPQSASSEDAMLPAEENHGNYLSGQMRQGESSYQIVDENAQLSNFVALENRHEEEKSQGQEKNINVRAAFIHVVGDIIQSIGVLVAALIIKFTEDPKFRLADPICTFLFSLLVLITTVAVLRDTLHVMMEAVPRNLSLDTLRKDLLAVEGVVAVHSLHVWALTMDRNAISVHLAIENSNLHDQVLSSALQVTQDRHHFFNSTIQVEQFDEEKSQHCAECLEVK